MLAMGNKLDNTFSPLTLIIITLRLIGGVITDPNPPSFFNSSDKTVLDYLLDHSKYDVRVRPQEETIVNVTVTLLTLSSPDESSLRYEVEFLLHQVWEDPRLKYNNGGRHKILNALTHAEKIWIPETYFIKHGDFKYPLVPVHITLRVTPEGIIQYTQRREMVLNCQGNLRIFPFDNPKCPFAYESDEYSCLKVLLVFTRDKSFYFSTVFVPGIILVSSSFISFWLDINAVPARVMIGVTTMLNFCTTTNSFRSTLPVVSSITAMNMWDGVCMFFIYASMLEFIVVNYLYRKRGHSHPTNRSASAANQPVTESSRSSSAVTQGCAHKVGQEDTNHESNNTRQEVPAFDDNRYQGAKVRAVASVFGWLRRPLVLEPDMGTRPKLAKKIDNVSKVVFPVLFFCFAFGFS
ncbi:glutamate-gated chloride channel-like isoform X6 [Tachypleus tridentatus]|uniref:glutamate-gated chloride channel-like isoform X6 n=1 Tax=Tachypleus tridentatus TaxID=6853 RepID=UPI003FD3115D